MKEIASALVKAQSQKTPEGRMNEARLMRIILPRKQANLHTSKDVFSRFFSHLAFGGSHCRYWIGSTDELGYGRFSYPEENKAHRASFRMFYGDIPAGMKVMHTCDTRCCVNPDHLKLGTQADNVADMVMKKRNRSVPQCGENNPMSRLTAEQVKEIRERVATGETQRSMCLLFNVSPMTVNRIVREKTWKLQ